jgi:predicted nucleic acid-binding protein
MLVDTSVWVDHLRRKNEALVKRLERAQVWTHPFIIGELACGHLSRRAELLYSLAALPQAPTASQDEVLALVEARALMGRGLGWIDIHLLAAARLARLPLWSLDRRLSVAARDLGLTVRN